MSNDSLATVLGDFASKIRQIVTNEILASIGIASTPAKRLGRPPKSAFPYAGNGAGDLPAKKPRKKPPVQYCPVPRCSGISAPAYGMVCARHRDLPKGEVRKYREARAAKKAEEKSKAKKSKSKAKKNE